VGDKQVNQTNGQWLGLHALKYRKLEEVQVDGADMINRPLFKIHTIEVNDWRNWSENQKMEFLFEITKNQASNRRGGASKKIPSL